MVHYSQGNTTIGGIHFSVDSGGHLDLVQCTSAWGFLQHLGWSNDITIVKSKWYQQIYHTNNKWYPSLLQDGDVKQHFGPSFLSRPKRQVAERYCAHELLMVWGGPVEEPWNCWKSSKFGRNCVTCCSRSPVLSVKDTMTDHSELIGACGHGILGGETPKR